MQPENCCKQHWHHSQSIRRESSHSGSGGSIGHQNHSQLEPVLTRLVVVAVRPKLEAKKFVAAPKFVVAPKLVAERLPVAKWALAKRQYGGDDGDVGGHADVHDRDDARDHDRDDAHDHDHDFPLDFSFRD